MSLWLVVSNIWIIFHCIWDHPSHWLSYFSGVGQPPTSLYRIPGIPGDSVHSVFFLKVSDGMVFSVMEWARLMPDVVSCSSSMACLEALECHNSRYLYVPWSHRRDGQKLDYWWINWKNDILIIYWIYWLITLKNDTQISENESFREWFREDSLYGTDDSSFLEGEAPL